MNKKYTKLLFFLACPALVGLLAGLIVCLLVVSYWTIKLDFNKLVNGLISILYSPVIPGLTMLAYIYWFIIFLPISGIMLKYKKLTPLSCMGLGVILNFLVTLCMALDTPLYIRIVTTFSFVLSGGIVGYFIGKKLKNEN